jgi:hypothetical protein
VLRGEEQRGLLEHDVRDGDADERARDLGEEVARHLTPRQAALARVREGHGGIEVRARDRTERQDQGYQPCARRDRVGQKRYRNVAARQLLAHDARTDDRREQERRAQSLGDELSQQHPLCLPSCIGLSCAGRAEGAQQGAAVLAGSSCRVKATDASMLETFSETSGLRTFMRAFL